MTLLTTYSGAFILRTLCKVVVMVDNREGGVVAVVFVDEDGFDLALVLRGSDEALLGSDETSKVLAISV